MTDFRTTDIDARINASIGPVAKALKGLGDGFDAFTTRANEKLDSFIDRLEELEAKSNSPGKAVGGGTAESREHVKLFSDWIRRPHDGAAKNALGEFESRIAKKDMSIGSGPGGGFAVPEVIGRQIESMERKLSPVRDLVRVVTVGTSDYKELLNLKGASSGWVGESGARNATKTSLLREVVPTHGELFAFPQASEWSLDDVFFNVGDWLATECSDSFAEQEGAAVISGDGNNKPTGMLNATPVATADAASPLRQAAAYQYLACRSPSSPAHAEITADLLIDLVYSVNAKYRAGASFVMNSATAGAVAKIKDGLGRYVWQQGLIPGMPSTLLGYPVAAWEQMPDIGTNAFPVGFGNFRRAYLLVDRGAARITVDNVTSPGFVKFYVRRREGGMILNNDSAKFLRTTIA